MLNINTNKIDSFSRIQNWFDASNSNYRNTRIVQSFEVFPTKMGFIRIFRGIHKATQKFVYGRS